MTLEPIDARTTRLLIRGRGAGGGSLLGLWFDRGIFEPMHFVMEQRQLRGIKERAEGVPLVPPALAAVARIGWYAAGIVVASSADATWIPEPSMTRPSDRSTSIALRVNAPAPDVTCTEGAAPIP